MADNTARVKRKTPKYQTFIWGRGSDGQLGLKDAFDHNLPTVIAAFNNKLLAQIACGGRHSLAVTSTASIGVLIVIIILFKLSIIVLVLILTFVHLINSMPDLIANTCCRFR